MDLFVGCAQGPVIRGWGLRVSQLLVPLQLSTSVVPESNLLVDSPHELPSMLRIVGLNPHIASTDM